MTLAMRRTQRSYIRVEADEVTYDLHILLRFRLEKALVDGSLEVAGMPTAWNELYQKLFGQSVDCDRNGCLQDVHWSFGLLGYFPTYSLGNINAAQLFHKAQQDPAVADALPKGETAPLLAWLRTHVHRQGSRLTPGDLIETATGEPPQPQYLIQHLRSRYLA